MFAQKDLFVPNNNHGCSQKDLFVPNNHGCSQKDLFVPKFSSPQDVCAKVSFSDSSFSVTKSLFSLREGYLCLVLQFPSWQPKFYIIYYGGIGRYLISYFSATSLDFNLTKPKPRMVGSFSVCLFLICLFSDFRILVSEFEDWTIVTDSTSTGSIGSNDESPVAHRTPSSKLCLFQFI